MARTHRLLALFAPGSIEAEINALQQAVFAASGCVSAIALPPLVPVRFLPADAPLRLPPMPGRNVPAGFTVRVTGPARRDGHLCLGLDTGGAWSGLRADDRWSDGPALFPCCEGFYLGCAEAGSGSAEPAADLGDVPLLAALRARRFTSVDLALVAITVPDEGPDWWREVRWQVDERRPLRGKRPPA